MPHVAPGWEPVAAAFQQNFEDGSETGAAVAIYHRGAKVLDLCGGVFAPGSDRPYDDTTLQLVFSTTKGITAIAVAMCVQRGLLSYTDRVADHWPEFAAEGKGDATVAQLLGHRCGLICPDAPLTLEEVFDWPTVTAALAATRPDWPIGTAHGYHALTYGWLAGELIRRVDGRDFGTFVTEEISDPLGVEMWIGLPESEEPRVSPLIPLPALTDPAMQAMIAQFIGPGTRGGRAMMLNGVIGDDTFNTRQAHAAQVPSAGGITTAAALARIYAATLGEIDGVRLLDEATREAAITSQTPPGEHDLCLLVPTVFAMGFGLPDPFNPYAGPGSFGHTGAGGSMAFAQPRRELAFGYVMNRMMGALSGDPRPLRIIRAAAGVIDAG
jgi:CubicO group peptidase (beta-lactamase class C family)